MEQGRESVGLRPSIKLNLQRVSGGLSVINAIVRCDQGRSMDELPRDDIDHAEGALPLDGERLHGGDRKAGREAGR